MTNRDDFLQATKRALCDRANNKCSFPTCNSPTSGPSDESTSKVDSTGMACHIFAAAPGKGAKRYDPNMTSEERRSAENGIWMCYRHGKQIDNDECRFTSEVLFKWKQVAERKAQLEHELGRSIEAEPQLLLDLGLARNEVKIESANGSENILIGDALKFSCANALWGEGLTAYIRGYLIERARNAIKHGGATYVKIEIESSKVSLLDDGDEFNHHDLLNHPNARGGAETKRKLIDTYGNHIISIAQRENGINKSVISILTNKNMIKDITPCTVELSYEIGFAEEYRFEVMETCSEIYVTIPDYFGLSDLGWVTRILPRIEGDERRLVFVLDDVADYLPTYISRAYPESRVINLRRR